MHTCSLRAGTTATYVEENHYIPKQHSRCSVLVGKPEGKRPLGRPRRWLEDDIKMDVNLFRGSGPNLSGTRQRQVAGSCERGHKPSGSLNASKFSSSWGTKSFPRRTLLHIASQLTPEYRNYSHSTILCCHRKLQTADNVCVRVRKLSRAEFNIRYWCQGAFDSFWISITNALRHERNLCRRNHDHKRC